MAAATRPRQANPPRLSGVEDLVVMVRFRVDPFISWGGRKQHGAAPMARPDKIKADFKLSR
jgi:hypothetical protein